jgi:hypothetical protein
MEKHRQTLVAGKANSVWRALGRPPSAVVVRGPLSADVVHHVLATRAGEDVLRNAYVFEGESYSEVQIERVARTTTFRGRRTALVFLRCEVTPSMMDVLVELRLPLVFVMGPEDKYRPDRNALAARCTVVWCGSETSSYLPRLLSARNYSALRSFRDCVGIQQLVHEEALVDFEASETLSMLDGLQRHHTVAPELLEYVTQQLVQECATGVREATTVRKRRRDAGGHGGQAVLVHCIQEALAQNRGAIPEKRSVVDYVQYLPQDDIFRLPRDTTDRKKLRIMNNRVACLRSFSSSVSVHTGTVTPPRRP